MLIDGRSSTRSWEGVRWRGPCLPHACQVGTGQDTSATMRIAESWLYAGPHRVGAAVVVDDGSQRRPSVSTSGRSPVTLAEIILSERAAFGSVTTRFGPPTLMAFQFFGTRPASREGLVRRVLGLRVRLCVA